MAGNAQRSREMRGHSGYRYHVIESGDLCREIINVVFYVRSRVIAESGIGFSAIIILKTKKIHPFDPKQGIPFIETR